MIINFNGYPNEVGDYIELPDIGELIMMPFFMNASIDDIRKHGTEFQRQLIDLTPFKNRNEYITGTFQVQFLTPSVIPARNIIGDYATDWHIDGVPFEEEEIFSHLLLNNVNARTEFNSKEFKIDFNDDIIKQNDIRDAWLKLNNYLNFNAENLLKPQKIEANKIISFSKRDVHRAVKVENYQFRFVWRALERNDIPPKSIEETLVKHSNVAKHLESIKSIEKMDNGFFVNI